MNNSKLLSPEWEEVLIAFKTEESAEDILPLIDDLDLQKIVLAWRRVEISIAIPVAPPTGDSNERWVWLWEHTTSYTDDLRACAGFSINQMAKVDRLYAQAQGNRLIYPDGTISTLALEYLGSLVVGRSKPRPTKRTGDGDIKTP